jgi:hypothetical protein
MHAEDTATAPSTRGKTSVNADRLHANIQVSFLIAKQLAKNRSLPFSRVIFMKLKVYYKRLHNVRGVVPECMAAICLF